MATATRHRPSRDMATGRHTAIRRRNKATRLLASASRRRGSRATRSCRKDLHKAGRLRATAAAHRLSRHIHSKAARRRPIRLTRSKAGKGSRRTPLTLSSKRRRRNSTAGHLRPRASTVALLRATEARRLSSNTAVRLLRAKVRLLSSSTEAPRKDTAALRLRGSSTALRPRDKRTGRLRAALPRKGNNTVRRRQLLRRLTTAHQHTPLEPMARRRDLRDRRTEFTRLLFRRSPRPIEIRYDETLRDERRPAEIETSL